jgi:hypothetical protein
MTIGKSRKATTILEQNWQKELKTRILEASGRRDFLFCYMAIYSVAEPEQQGAETFGRSRNNV